jgi:hypothetical protein
MYEEWGVREKWEGSPESDLLQVEGILDDTGGGHSHPQNILLCGQVVCCRYSVYVREVTTQGENTV